MYGTPSKILAKKFSSRTPGKIPRFTDLSRGKRKMVMYVLCLLLTKSHKRTTSDGTESEPCVSIENIPRYVRMYQSSTYEKVWSTVSMHKRQIQKKKYLGSDFYRNPRKQTRPPTSPPEDIEVQNRRILLKIT